MTRDITFITTIIASYAISVFFYIKRPYDSLYSYIFWILSILLIFICISYKEKFKINSFNFKNFSFIKFINNNKLIIVILILGTIVRFWNLTSIPILTHDEAKDAGLFPQKIISGELKDYFGFNAGINNNFFILSSIPHLIITDPILKVRLFSALFGVLSILLIYLLAKSVFNKRVALISAALLSVYHVHIHFSRTEFLNLFDRFYGLLIFIAFSSLSGSWKINNVIMLATILGLGLHFYSGLRAIILLTTITFVIFTLVKNNFKKIVPFFIVFLFFFLVALGPIIVVMTTRGEEFKAEGTATVISSASHNLNSAINQIAVNYKNSLLSYIQTPIDFHYNYGGPFLIVPFSIFFLLGLLLAFSQIKKPIYLLIILSIFGIPFFNSAILNTVNYTHRLLSLIPLIIILTSFGIEKIAGLLKKLTDTKIALLFIVAICIYFAYYNIHLYFYKNIWERTLNINEFRAWESQKIINNLDKNTVTFFIGNDYYPSYRSVPPLEYLTQKHEIVDIIDREKLYQSLYKNVNNYLLIIMPDNKAMLDQQSLVKYLYPNKISSKKIYYKDMYLFDALRITKT